MPILLTDRFIQGLKPRARQYEVADRKEQGLTLRVLPSGTKTWAFRYRAGRSWRRVSLGVYPTLSLADARDGAREHLRAVQKEGRDPSREKRERYEAPTVAELAERFLAEHVTAKRKAATVEEYDRILRLHVLPKLGRVRAADVTRGDLATLHHAMRETPTQANRTLAVLSKMFNLAERWSVRPDGSNPCRHIERY